MLAEVPPPPPDTMSGDDSENDSLSSDERTDSDNEADNQAALSELEEALKSLIHESQEKNVAALLVEQRRQSAQLGQLLAMLPKIHQHASFDYKLESTSSSGHGTSSLMGFRSKEDGGRSPAATDP